ncbi:hypothetical protein HOLleu_36565 [Holothuria leucospilota]|uniref:Uncharacterized protein n=1 Tax=Holothuria leucospilota TaxID=206669 RepID=A0A9Q1BFR7_HOLLE|nr:hypothetical protein HOLleu_36565 [Holothuria leucospilota]
MFRGATFGTTFDHRSLPNNPCVSNKKSKRKSSRKKLTLFGGPSPFKCQHHYPRESRCTRVDYRSLRTDMCRGTVIVFLEADQKGSTMSANVLHPGSCPICNERLKVEMWCKFAKRGLMASMQPVVRGETVSLLKLAARHEIPVQLRVGSEVKSKKTGRPRDDDQEQAFSKICTYQEVNDEEQLTIAYLQCKMKEYLTNSQQKGDEEVQKRSIIKTAARLIRSDIKTNVSSVTDHYPKSEELKLESALKFLPETPRHLLDFMFVGKDKHHKVACIGQAIVQAVRPRALIAPLQIGFGVQVYHLFWSKFLVQSLWDNVEHKIITIDGKGTFNEMGMIAALTPEKQTSYIVSRRNVSELITAETSKVDIMEYRFDTHVLRNIKFQKLLGLQHCDMGAVISSNPFQIGRARCTFS